MDFNFEIQGLKEFNKVLDQLPEQLAKKVYPRAVAKPAGQLRNELKRHTPKKTGLTRKAFGVFKKRTGNHYSAVYGVGPYRRVRAVNRKKRLKRHHLARWIEKGTKPRKHRSGKFTGSMPARPFIRRVADGFIQSGQAQRIMARELSISLAREAERSASQLGTRRRGRRRR